MKKVLVALVGIILLGGLGFGTWYFFHQKNAGNFHQMLVVADTAEMTFTDGAQNKTYKKTVQYLPEVWLLTGTITDVAVPNIKCDFQGTIQFFAQGKPLFAQPAAINLEPECQQIAFLYNGKVYHKRFLQEGVDYLKDVLVELKK